MRLLAVIAVCVVFYSAPSFAMDSQSHGAPGIYSAASHGAMGCCAGSSMPGHPGQAGAMACSHCVLAMQCCPVPLAFEEIEAVSDLAPGFALRFFPDRSIRFVPSHLQDMERPPQLFS